MPKVIALYRYPVKGFTPEVCTQLTILPGGRVAGDRVLTFRFADAPVADDAWCRKSHGVVLANTPGLARLHVRYDAHARRLRLEAGAHVLADEALDVAGRTRLAAALTSYVQALTDNPLTEHPERLPVKLVGTGSPHGIRIPWPGRPPCTAVRAWRPRVLPLARPRSTNGAFGTTS